MDCNDCGKETFTLFCESTFMSIQRLISPFDSINIQLEVGYTSKSGLTLILSHEGSESMYVNKYNSSEIGEKLSLLHVKLRITDVFILGNISSPQPNPSIESDASSLQF